MIGEDGTYPVSHRPSERDVQIARELRDLAGRFRSTSTAADVDVLMARVGMPTRAKSRKDAIAEGLLHAAKRVEGGGNRGIA